MSYIKKEINIFITLSILIFEIINFWHNYSLHSNLFTSMYRNDGQKQLVNYVKDNLYKYVEVYIPSYGTMSMYYLFFPMTLRHLTLIKLNTM